MSHIMHEVRHSYQIPRY